MLRVAIVLRSTEVHPGFMSLSCLTLPACLGRLIFTHTHTHTPNLQNEQLQIFQCKLRPRPQPSYLLSILASHSVKLDSMRSHTKCKLGIVWVWTPIRASQSTTKDCTHLWCQELSTNGYKSSLILPSDTHWEIKDALATFTHPRCSQWTVGRKWEAKIHLSTSVSTCQS